MTHSDNHFITFSQRLLAWFKQYGRKDLPWQSPPTPYRVWVSEIMLQQTQVKTVIPYYQRFMQRFPDLATLATASLDEVLHCWTGLGYYARARNLHRAAQQIHNEYADKFPNQWEDLKRLSGIGASTAGAILAIAYQQTQPILDGNVKRVLCRYYAIAGWPGKSEIEKQLWRLARQHTPIEQVAEYTQAIMDLGATVCTRHQPRCQVCPFTTDCLAHQNSQETVYPWPKPRSKLPVKTTMFIMVQIQTRAVLLQQRPPDGLWGGLWSFPECVTLIQVKAWCMQYLSLVTPTCYTWHSLRHTFTHFHLDITPIHIPVEVDAIHSMALDNTLWYDINHPPTCGLAAPVVRLLAQLSLSNHNSII